ncbi:MAG: hypothetical protein NC191_04535 [Muribaculaceae bacterium]|nr:hypothetical protein [Muribaculaceae bacterium]
MKKWYDDVIGNDVRTKPGYNHYFSYPHLIKNIEGDFNYCIYDKDKYIQEELALFYKHLKKLDYINWILFAIGFFCFFTWIVNIIYLIARNKKKKELEIVISKDSYIHEAAKVFEEVSQKNIMHVALAQYELRYGCRTLKDVIKTSVPYIELDCWELYFIDKGILFYNYETFFILPYQDIDLMFQENKTNMIKPPTNAEIIGITWEHLNKNGTPNKRYKDNNEIHVIKSWVTSIKTKDNSICFEFVLFNNEAASKFYNTINTLIERSKQ